MTVLVDEHDCDLWSQGRRREGQEFPQPLPDQQVATAVGPTLDPQRRDEANRGVRDRVIVRDDARDKMMRRPERLRLQEFAWFGEPRILPAILTRALRVEHQTQGHQRPGTPPSPPDNQRSPSESSYSRSDLGHDGSSSGAS